MVFSVAAAGLFSMTTVPEIVMVGGFASRWMSCHRNRPAPREAGRITGNHHRRRRYDRRLLRTYYDRKRTEGKIHIQAIISLARRRLNVVWAMLRDGTTDIPVPAQAARLAA
jgi:hypothetical protein